MSDITITRSVRRPAGRLAALIAIPFLIGSLAACSSGSPDSSSKTPKAVQSFDDWQVAFASCMRDEGVDMPDPEQNGSGGTSVTLGDGDQDAFQDASATCIDRLGTPPAPAGGNPAVADAFEQQLEMAECFREHGYEMADPVKGQAMQIPSDVTEEVMEACGLSSDSSAPLGSTGR
ncbi:hypothetical protein A4X17_10230 [Plantibacter sp. H53]|uniref:hypothetical protein n=1 Tax=Plantibacter sp. H53 TaxID=1827323 RepID=UPI0007DA479D|nr:hypothetical protein [Plantibacter sp. H53]OAN35317.1 hypothetical protein A4X17_10230 [Plantibacter sp. H53]